MKSTFTKEICGSKFIFATVIIASLLAINVCLAETVSEADRALEASLRAAINEPHVHIHVRHGIVTLKGKVSTEADRDGIEGVIRNTNGVVGVQDELKVSPNPARGPAFIASPPLDTSPIILMAPLPPIATDGFYPKLVVQPITADDAPVASEVAKQLRVGGLQPSGVEKVHISIMNGRASLKGNVNSQDEHDAIIRSINRAWGVNAIYDQMQIVPPENGDF